MYKAKKILKWAIIGSILTVLTLFTLLVAFIMLFLFGGPAKKSNNVKDYSDIFELRLHSGIVVFPEEIDETMTDITFSYYYRDTWDDPTVCIFLQGTYSPEAYEAEVARLENFRKVYGGTERKLLQDEDNKYPYPVYIAMENYSYAYEYALLSGENEITYIYTAFFDKEDIKFGREYLPSDFMTDEGRSFGSGYSIYVKLADSMGISYDYSRDEQVVVQDAHMKHIDDSSFIVRVQLDEQNREVITTCEFYYYEPYDKEDIEALINLEPEITIFNDLNGYIYKDLRLNEDRTVAIVTYLDGEEEKEWELELTGLLRR